MAARAGVQAEGLLLSLTGTALGVIVVYAGRST